MTETDIVGLADKALDAARDGNGRMLLAMALMAIVWFTRKLLAEKDDAKSWLHNLLASFPVASKFVNTDAGGATLTLLMGVAGSVATVLMSSAPLTVGAVWSGIVMGITAAGGYVMIKRLLGPLLAWWRSRNAVPPVAVLLCLALLPGCPGFGAHVKASAECAAKEVQSAIPSLLVDVYHALAKDWGWQDALGVLESRAGVILVRCTVERILADGAAPGVPAASSEKRARVNARAREYLTEAR